MAKALPQRYYGREPIRSGSTGWRRALSAADLNLVTSRESALQIDPGVVRAGVGHCLDHAHVTHPFLKVRMRTHPAL
ncbi:MAG: hypothetical protein QOH39_1351 [Verrucomicrobiota bacterium]